MRVFGVEPTQLPSILAEIIERLLVGGKGEGQDLVLPLFWIVEGWDLTLGDLK